MILSIFFELLFPLDLSIVLFWRGDCELPPSHICSVFSGKWI
jgi:hypothetical protein